MTRKLGDCILLVVLVAGSCVSSSTRFVELGLRGADGPIATSGSTLRPGDRVTGELDLGLLADSTTRVSGYYVTLATPIVRNRGEGELLFREDVPLNPPMLVTPGESAIIRWSFTVTEEMAQRTGEYRLGIEVRELGATARARFAVRR